MIKDQNKISIVIADDHPMFRSGVRTELEKDKELIVIAETGNGKEAYDLITKMNPDIALLDIQMPELNGIEITSKLKTSNSETKIILLTMYNEKSVFLKAIKEGVNGYLLKDDAVQNVIRAVKLVYSGKEYISQNLTDVLVKHIKEIYSEDETLELVGKLTSLEKIILLLISDLKTNDELSEILGVAKRTIENQKFNIAKKLELNGARELLKFSVKNKHLLLNDNIS